MKFRKPMSNGKSRRLFNRTVKRTAKVNIAPPPMRGGIRL